MQVSTVPTTDRHEISDATLTAQTADLIAVPRLAEANSFVLHAPLELLARTALLPYVDPASRHRARDRISEIAASYVSLEPADFPARHRAFEGVVDAVAHLVDAMRANDLAGADEAADWLGTHLSPIELTDALADSILSSLAAAAHAPIFFWLTRRVNPRSNLTGRLLRPLVRELTRHSAKQLHWIDTPTCDTPTGDAPTSAFPSATGNDMTAAMAATPRLGVGPSNFIAPTMSRIDSAEVAAVLLGPVCGTGEIGDRGRAVVRAAAWSMLGEPPTHSAYGWTHALTMSQAAIGIARSCDRPSRALATAATYVMGFRASLAVNPLIDGFEPDRVNSSLSEAFSNGPDTAAAAAWHFPTERRAELITHLATSAAAHPDAHQAKYTLACLDAIGDDPQSARLYLTAAAKLAGYWASIATPNEH